MCDEAIEAEEEECEGVDSWMATFADMMSLLLTFFILLLSFSSLDVIRFRMALGSVKDALGVQYAHPGDMEAVSTSLVELSETESTDKLRIIDENQLLREVKTLVEKKGMKDVVEVEQDARGIIVRIRGHILFRTGSDRLLRDAVGPLDTVAEIGKLVPYPLAVEGHTDNRPIKTGRFPSNWELSTARATAAMRYLVNKGGLDEARMQIAGYSHIRPIAPNTTEEGRARNRRVEFVFVRPVDRKNPGLKAGTEQQNERATYAVREAGKSR